MRRLLIVPFLAGTLLAATPAKKHVHLTTKVAKTVDKYPPVHYAVKGVTKATVAVVQFLF